MQYFDKFGVELQVGDAVVYTTGAQGNTTLDLGHIVSFHVRRGLSAAMLRSSRGRMLINDRLCCKLVSTTPIRAQHPELFI